MPRRPRSASPSAARIEDLRHPADVTRRNIPMAETEPALIRDLKRVSKGCEPQADLFGGFDRISEPRRGGRAFRIGIRNLLVRSRLLRDLARLPGFGRNPDDLRPFLQPVFPAPVPRSRRKPVAKPHAT